VDPSTSVTKLGKFYEIIVLQKLAGYWEETQALATALGTDSQNLNYMVSSICNELRILFEKTEERYPNIVKVAVSLLVLATLEKKFESKALAWQLLGEKTKGWICREIQVNAEQLQSALQAARGLCDDFLSN